MLYRTAAVIAASLLLACCNQQRAREVPEEPAAEPAPAAAPATAVNTPAPPEAPAPAAPETPDTPTPQGEVTPDVAAGVAREYFALVGAKQYAMAAALSDTGAPRPSELAKQYDKYASLDATIGAPGPQQGAAGSSYIDIPVKVVGKLKSGGSETLEGTITLRRANDVPGSTTAERHWRVYKIDLKPTA